MFDADLAHGLWLVEDYFPEIVHLPTEQRAPSVADVRAHLHVGTVSAVPVPADCVDGFAGCYWNRPEAYLRDGVRSAMSCFANLGPEIEARGALPAPSRPRLGAMGRAPRSSACARRARSGLQTRRRPMTEAAPPVEGSKRRRDIEGLRGVAVFVVVAFHVGLPLFSGGFIGVDVFFVISGYLITRNLLIESGSTGRVSLRSTSGPVAFAGWSRPCRSWSSRPSWPPCSSLPATDIGCSRQAGRLGQLVRLQHLLRSPAGRRLLRRTHPQQPLPPHVVARRGGAVLPGLAGDLLGLALGAALAISPPCARDRGSVAVAVLRSRFHWVTSARAFVGLLRPADPGVGVRVRSRRGAGPGRVPWVRRSRWRW